MNLEAKNLECLLGEENLSGIEVSLTDLLDNSSKSQKYINANQSIEDIKSAHVQNVLNMRTVQEGTAVAGSFCNRFLEIARNYKLNLILSRAVCDIFQRIALDSKHNGASENGYKDLDWYKLASYLNKMEKNVSFKEVFANVSSIIKNGELEVKAIPKATRGRASFVAR